MNSRRVLCLFSVAIMAALSLAAHAQEPSKTEKAATSSPDSRLTEEDRKIILRSFASELVFIHTPFPMGKIGLRIDPQGKIYPSEQELTQLISQFGPAAKPGDRARISDVIFKKNGIVFEINGGPVKRKKWYERLEISGAGGGSVRPADKTGDADPYQVNARGSFVILEFKDHVPSLNPEQLRGLLTPVFDFRATSVAEAYQKSLPPKLAEAVKNHRALVGMDREMVTYAKGRPPKRHREAAGDTEYEEWIYGEPPAEVEFIRFVGDKVVRIETMKVDGEKIVRTDDELAEIRAELAAQKEKEKESEADSSPPSRPAPSLVRPGEAPAKTDPGNRPQSPRPQTTGTTDGPP